ncbi:MAG: hypothetical protein AVDCRST_MAG19-2961 [uncultured Thermomicrobiales bacterium]|uniref:Uncharacterized protein n=1 Tax=uncultured Thermomicrobiales bacterium TaxID=1645740 RepID=A0A6J4VD04_9BACT|nr:MAG: hypothetical protein AVDCRST_MAG19-2961 [uncultured Thermomicrobiales bacterium]
MDRPIVRAHRHAAGAKGAPEAEALGRRRGGFATLARLHCERGGKPLALVVTGGEGHELPVRSSRVERGAVKRPGRGRLRGRRDRVAGDNGSSSPGVRRYLAGRRIGAATPTKADEAPDPAFDRAAYRERNVAERPINRLRRSRRVATRYEIAPPPIGRC